MIPATRDERLAALLAFLRTIQRPGHAVETLDADASLITAGLIDSLAVLEIVSYLEATYAIDFTEKGIDPGDLSSIAGILDVIEREAPPNAAAAGGVR